MSEEKAKTLASLAKVLNNKKKLNNTLADLELLWQGINLYYLKQSSEDSFTEEDRNIVAEHLSQLLAAFEPILSVKSDEFHPEEETVI